MRSCCPTVPNIYQTALSHASEQRLPWSHSWPTGLPHPLPHRRERAAGRPHGLGQDHLLRAHHAAPVQPPPGQQGACTRHCTNRGHKHACEHANTRTRVRSYMWQVIYIAPLKALVRERIEDWQRGLCVALNKSMVELTGEPA